MRSVIKAVPLVVLCALIIAVPSAWANWIQAGVPLCTATGEQSFPTITSDGAGGAIVTWHDHRSGNVDIYAQRVNASGAVQWTTDGVVVCTAPGEQYSPTIVSDGAGGAIVTWYDYRGGYYADIYAQRVDASGIVQWTTDGVALCMAPGDQYIPAIVSDGAGGAIVTWSDYRMGNLDIYAQRVDASGTVQWTTDGVALCMAPGDQYIPAIVSDGAGGAIVTWYDGRTGDADIYAQRVDASGTVQWTADGLALCKAPGHQYSATITSDGAGGAIVTWYDYRSGSNWDVYAQRVSASGNVQWTTDGVALCTAAGDQYIPAIVSDGAGGAIVTWHDNRGGSNWDVYAQRVNASGTVQWTVTGVALCRATGQQYSPAISSDGAGGAIVTWYDNRSGNNEIYAQRVNASGTTLWATDDAALCTVTGDQTNPTIISDGSSCAIVTWQDYRNGNWDIYALRGDANGFAVLTGTDAPAVRIELHQNYPNPFNPTTTVTYSVPAKCNVTLKIYDVSGKCIACLVDRREERGSHAVEWNGKDENGNSVASGIYLYRLAAGTQTISRKMVLLR